ncbi:MAG: Verru_Chthon cassette protein B [Verrucomicrobiota bacterium]
MKKGRSTVGHAFTLVEIAMALGIMSFCLVILLGLLPVSLTTLQNASEETAGINIISTIITDLKSTPVTSGTSSTYQLTFPTAPGGGNQALTMYFDKAGGVTKSIDARYKVTVTLSPPTLQNTITGIARVSWPAMAVNPTSAVEVFLALNRN